MKTIMVSALLLMGAQAMAVETAPASCNTKMKEVLAALKTAGRLLATPQENWNTRDIDRVYNVLDKYKGAGLADDGAELQAPGTIDLAD